MVDIVYQGFGDGLVIDGDVICKVVVGVKQCLIVVFCLKNFGIYCEWIGIFMVVVENVEQVKLVQVNFVFLNCQNYFFLFDYGVWVVIIILNDFELCVDWEVELEEVCLLMFVLCQQFVDELCCLINSDWFDFIVEYCGMFLWFGILFDKVDIMCEKNGIYMVGDSCINIVGLNIEIVLLLVKVIVELGV